jgi:hypothetical protein
MTSYSSAGAVELIMKAFGGPNVDSVNLTRRKVPTLSPFFSGSAAEIKRLRSGATPPHKGLMKLKIANLMSTAALKNSFCVAALGMTSSNYEDESLQNGFREYDEYYQGPSDRIEWRHDEAVKNFSNMAALRDEGTFCDVSFIVQGVIFKAHRIVLSSWSRWFRALLVNAPMEEIIALDVFEPVAFGKIIDYMYGATLFVEIEEADALMRVIRRLEMHFLEDHVWEYFLSVVTSENCTMLHDLADRYDCAPLKLAAWRELQAKNTSYAKNPARQLLVASSGGKDRGGRGLTGPGENLPEDYGHATAYGEISRQGRGRGVANLAVSAADNFKRILERSTGPAWMNKNKGRTPEENAGKYVEEDDDDDDGNTEASEGLAAAMQDVRIFGRVPNRIQKAVLDPNELPEDVPAAALVGAWATRLQVRYTLHVSHYTLHVSHYHGHALFQISKQHFIFHSTFHSIAQSNHPKNYHQTPGYIRDLCAKGRSGWRPVRV